MTETGLPDIQAGNVGRTACPTCGSIVDVSQAKAFETVQCDQCTTRFSAPGRLGPYILLKHLGKGEMGMTFKAYEKTMGRHVAIKVLRRSLCDDRTLVDGFFSEARALASLDHPNVARAFSVGEATGQPYIVMELIDGKRLDQLFTPDEPLDEYRALAIGIGVAEALKAATGKGLIHSDVKPANILLTAAGEPKLVDFGIARFGGGRLGGRDAIGTPYYLAPEQVSRGSIDLRTDIYALGATLFHALAGRPPFPGTDVREVMAARLARPAPDLWSLRQDIHTETAAIVARMLEKDPAGRYGDYASLLADLRGAWGLCTPPASQGQAHGGARPPGSNLDMVSEALAGRAANTAHRAAPARAKPSAPARPAAPPARTGHKTAPRHANVRRAARKRPPARAGRPVDWIPWIIAGAVILVIALVALFAHFWRSRRW